MDLNCDCRDFRDEHDLIDREHPMQTNKKAVDWRLHIHADPEILGGKPVVKGTRLSVDFILGLFANGWTFQEIFESYPRLSREAVQAVFAYPNFMVF